MGAALREPLAREEVLARLAAAGAPRFTAEAVGMACPDMTEPTDLRVPDRHWGDVTSDVAVSSRCPIAHGATV